MHSNSSASANALIWCGSTKLLKSSENNRSPVVPHFSISRTINSYKWSSCRILARAVHELTLRYFLLLTARNTWQSDVSGISVQLYRYVRRVRLLFAEFQTEHRPCWQWKPKKWTSHGRSWEIRVASNRFLIHDKSFDALTTITYHSIDVEANSFDHIQIRHCTSQAAST